jgi:hypothetical protein
MTMASARLQLGAIFACHAAAGLYWGTIVATLSAFQTRSNLSPADFGPALMARTVGGIIAMQGLGGVLHRVQTVAVPGCLALFAAGMTVLAFAEGPVAPVVGLAPAGAASGAAMAGGAHVWAAIYLERERAAGPAMAGYAAAAITPG